MVVIKGDCKEQIYALLRENKSLYEIMRITGLKKTTIYYHMKKVCGRKQIPVDIDRSNLERIGEIVGLFAGDGSADYDKKKRVWRVRFFMNVKETILVEYYVRSISSILDKKPQVYSSPSTSSVSTIQLCSKSFYNLIQTHLIWNSNKTESIRLIDQGILQELDFAKGFVRGLIDSDGYVRKGRPEIYFGTVSAPLLLDFLYALELFRFEYSVYYQHRPNHLKFYKVRLSGKEVEKLIELIRPLKRL